ncbi:thymidylate synthase [Mycobacterium phage Serenity]|uniref:thymidylate synthase n=1 Tax=Mycobacterium phage Serenity TaxID=1701853 RepID=UPI0006CE3D7B|nr:thymidylate synthase [Mycobacterium phage Serenity]ALF00916.1 ThyX-like thymidylate synthase [Mycobacterium phage Serenity]ATN92175.1 ThyX-like thymidylate synthase [Mycobacterium phage TipsytheTRex]
MKVQLIASTHIYSGDLSDIGYDVATEWDEWGDQIHEDADELAEFAGRNCYRSFHRPNPATASNEDYLKHILEVGHESVLEHASATFYIEASRSVLTELERHRHLSFSVVSQRYVDPIPLGTHKHPTLDYLEGGPYHHELPRAINEAVGAAWDAYNLIYTGLIEAGRSRKQAREAARSVLPNMTNSPMVVTGNHRAWRYVIKARWHEAADAEIRELAGELLRQLREVAPNTYQDIPTTPYSY